MSRRQELAARRAMLVARSQLQRRELATSAGDIAHSLRSVDAAVSVARRATAHPLLLAGAAAALVVVVKPRRLLHGLSLGLSAAVAVRRAAELLRTGN